MEDAQMIYGKYRYKTEQIMHYLILSGELPSDIYKVLNISEGYFKQVILRLKNDGLISVIRKQGLTGYVLTAKGKEKYALNDKYSRYIRTNRYDIGKRKRCHNYAYIYALFDKLSIPYEWYNKPPIENALGTVQSQLLFYSTSEYKQHIGNAADKIKGSKAYGFFIFNRTVMPLYKARYELPVFNSVESSLKVFIGTKDNPNDKAVLMCENQNAMLKISRQLVFLEDEGKGYDLIDPITGYKGLIMFSQDKSRLCLWLLMNDKKAKKAALLLQGANKAIQNDTKNAICDCYINHTPTIVVLNFDLWKIKAFLNFLKFSGNAGIIICFDYQYNVLLNLNVNTSQVEIKTISSEKFIKTYVDVPPKE